MRPFAIGFMTCALLSIVLGESAVPQATRVQVVMLGTGTPLPDPERSGPSIAVVVDNHAYLFDAGTGVVRRAAATTKQKGIAGLEPRTLRFAFLTHLHSDHTLGLPDLILTPWTMGRTEPLELWGVPHQNLVHSENERVANGWWRDVSIRSWP